MKGNSGTDVLDEILSDFTEVDINGKILQLGLPSPAELVKVRQHVDLQPDERKDYEGGPLAWSNDFYALCLAATVRHSKKRSPEDWRVLASISNSLCRKAGALCGYPVDEREEQLIKEKVQEAVKSAGEAISPLPS